MTTRLRTCAAILFVAVPVLAVAAAGLADPPAALAPRAAFRPVGGEINGHRTVLGTDRGGRDFAVVLLKATRPSLVLAAVGTAVVLAGALVWGFLEGTTRRLGGALGVLALAVLALPDLAILAAVRGGWPEDSTVLSGETLARLTNLSVLGALAVLAVPSASRVLADRVRHVAGSAFVARTRAYGAGRWYLLRKEYAPQLLADLLWLASTTLPRFVYLEAALAFLGLGYRGMDGLGQVLVSCHQNCQNPVARTQLLVTTGVLVWVCLWPHVLLTMIGRARTDQTEES